MKSEIEVILNSVCNPVTQVSLREEGRIIELDFNDQELIMVYNREGIGPSEKRTIENQVIALLKGKVSEEHITIKTVSKDSKDIFQAANQSSGKVEAPKAPEQKAALNVGHGPQGQAKKRVEGAKRVVAISSGKGGVGKSTISVNLALSLQKLGHKVGLLDADIYGPSIPMLLGQRLARPQGTEDKKIVPIESFGLKFISFGLFVEEKEAVIWRGPMLGGVLNQFLFDVQWGDLDYLIIDLPPGTGDMQLSLAQAVEIDGVIGVSTPQDVALLDSRKGLNMFEKVKVPIIGMIENMSYFVPEDAPEKKYYIFGQDGVKKAAAELGVAFLGGIPLEISMREGSDSGVPYMSDEKNMQKSGYIEYMNLAKNLDKTLNSKNKSFMSKLFQR